MGKSVDQLQKEIDKLDEGEQIQLRSYLNDRLLSVQDDTQGSADASADDAKRKYIAQHMDDPNAQTSAQSVPEPVSDEVKDLQNKAARIEHEAKGPAADGSH